MFRNEGIEKKKLVNKIKKAKKAKKATGCNLVTS